jgi:hypothetical protein
MGTKKILFMGAFLLFLAVIVSACAGPAGAVGPAGPAGPVGPAGPAGADGKSPAATDLTCTQCHNGTDLLSSKTEEWQTSQHGMGELFIGEGYNPSCAGCHSGGGFSDMIAANLTPDKVTAGDPHPSKQDCRACHVIHTTYTKDDFALRTTAPVAQFATASTFDGGEGNLCANCHQARRAFPAAAADGTVDVTNRFGPHHGPQSNFLLGVGGSPDVKGSPSPHYSTVKDTCVACHLGGPGEAADHTFLPNVANCQKCHADATDFNMKGSVTDLEAKIATLKTALTTAGLLDKAGAIVPGKYPVAKASALWNYLLVAVEDKSNGVHNMPYAEALIDAALAGLK